MMKKKENSNFTFIWRVSGNRDNPQKIVNELIKRTIERVLSIHK
ncbi:hypothetical protein [Mesobacillus foraminis]|nr:hypothetical protein [Mesobacillus foraminis]